MAHRAQGQSVKWDNQNFFQLAAIQSASLGLSVIIIGQQLALKYGAGTAICSIAVGNLLLWLIAIIIITMVDRAHSNAIDNIKSYIGRYGGWFVAFILVLTFLNWYSFQLNSVIGKLNELYQFDIKWKLVALKFGAGFGLLTALLSIGGVRFLKWLTMGMLPLLFLYHIYAIASADFSVPIIGTWGLSFEAVLTAVLILLPGVINFPTFFRHSRSKGHSYLALTLLTVFISFFEITTIWMQFSFPGSVLGGKVLFFSGYIILMMISCNLLNIYFASASWEAIIPRFGGSKGFAIIGLLGTGVYTFIQISYPVMYFEDLTNSYITCLGVVLLLAFLIRVIVKHRLRPFEQYINLATWLFGCVVATVYEALHPLQGVDALLAGVNASIVFLLCAIFVEETSWAVKRKFGVLLK